MYRLEGRPPTYIICPRVIEFITECSIQYFLSQTRRCGNSTQPSKAIGKISQHCHASTQYYLRMKIITIVGTTLNPSSTELPEAMAFEPVSNLVLEGRLSALTCFGLLRNAKNTRTGLVFCSYTETFLTTCLLPKSIQPLLLCVCVDVGTDNERNDVEKRNPCVLREELLGKGQS